MRTGAINGVGKDVVVDVGADRADSSEDGGGNGEERELHYDDVREA